MRSRTFIPNLLIVLTAVHLCCMSTHGDDPRGSGPRLREIVAAYWTDLMRTHPIEATIFVGDQRYSDRLDDPSVEAYDRWLERLRVDEG